MAEETGKAVESNLFTAGETNLLVTIMQNLTGEIPYDADAVAQKLGYKDGTIVKARWSQIKRKKINAAGASPNGVVKKRAPKKAAKAAAAEEGDDEEAAVPDTPIKTPAKRGRKPKAKKEESVEEEGGKAEDEEEGGKVKEEEAEES